VAGIRAGAGVAAIQLEPGLPQAMRPPGLARLVSADENFDKLGRRALNARTDGADHRQDRRARGRAKGSESGDRRAANDYAAVAGAGRHIRPRGRRRTVEANQLNAPRDQRRSQGITKVVGGGLTARRVTAHCCGENSGTRQ